MHRTHPRNFAQIIEATPFVNPTKELIQTEIERLGVQTFRMPAVSDPSSIPQTLDSLARSSGILIDGALVFRLWSSVSTQTDMLVERILNLGIPTVLVGLRDDPHGGTSKEYESLRESGLLYLNTAVSPQFYAPPNYRFAERSIDLQAPFFLEGPEILGTRYVLTPHALAPEEFYNPIGRRSAVSVLGVPYPYRQIATRQLHESRVHMLRRVTTVDRALRRLANVSEAGRKIYRWRFNRALRLSAVSVTCDGGVGYPVRKFFEIPAAGAVLVGRLPPRAEALGFIDGVNCFDVREPDDVPMLIESLLAQPSRLESVATLGQAMVRQRHSISARARQLLTLLALESQSLVRSTTWTDGDLWVKTSANDLSSTSEWFKALFDS